MSNEEWQKTNLAHAVTFAVEGIKAGLVLNGGAAVALMALMGAIQSKDAASIKLHLEVLPHALRRFAAGAGAAGGALAVCYFSQICWVAVNEGRSPSWRWAAEITRLIAAVLLLLSFWWFYRGASIGASAFAI